ncbi:nucleoid-associated protein [Acinetobacter sp. ANC 4862]|uniref:nucleoid-associated protein n=1 Tax=Acinetobacter sp. ANC 4862 TaxID=2529849 RepID=UPI00103FDF23|nr:nucleoid-associated protein [Acinetobacter sp. ANC 4862]TCH62498.1 nucleoid-associated protein [Acinetobacter sp. ANC 4862]
MSTTPCEISSFIVHKLVRDSEGANFNRQVGSSILTVNSPIQGLMDELNKKYIEQGGRTFGKFSDDTINYPISTILTDAEIYSKSDNFYDLSIKILDHLVAKVKGKAVTGGWVVICLYNYNNQKFIAIAVVNEIIGAGINESFEVEKSVYIDLSKLRHAGRVNLTQWQNQEDRYVSFIRGSHTSSEYFKEFLGCETTNDNVLESNKLIDVLNSYLDQQNYGYEERTAISNRAYDFLKAASKAKTPIFLEHLSNILLPTDPDSLRTFLASDQNSISDGFIPDSRSLKRLIELKTKSRYWDIKLSREAFKHGAEYDPQTGKLTIPVDDTEDKAMFAKQVQGLEEDDAD